jgi:hypothetical protein
MKLKKFNLVFVVFALILLLATHKLSAYTTNDLRHPDQQITNEQLMCPMVEPGKVPERSQRGCCSHHGGVLGCAKNGRTICRDCTYSPRCYCR